MDQTMSETLTVHEAPLAQGSPYRQRIETGPHQWLADLPVPNGGDDAGPAPLDLIAASLGACTNMTLRMYAERKQMPLTHVQVNLRRERRERDGRPLDALLRTLTLEGPLSPEQRQRLLEIAGRCPIARLLEPVMLLECSLAD